MRWIQPRRERRQGTLELEILGATMERELKKPATKRRLAWLAFRAVTSLRSKQRALYRGAAFQVVGDLQREEE